MTAGIGRTGLVCAIALSLTATPVLARKAHSLSDINGVRATSAEGMLRDRGFAYVSGHKDSMGFANSYWWHSADRNCVIVEVDEGRVMTINDASDGDCGHNGGGNTAAAVGVVAGAALLGALLSHKSGHHDNNQHLADQSADQQYERGYRDGLYNAPYHNFDRANAYSDGYTAGVEERRLNLSHHHGHGGYVQAASFNDLNGARAAGGMSELERRGFVQVDNFTSGDTRYSIQWRAASRQCVQVTIADGEIYDVRDIGQHKRCR